MSKTDAVRAAMLQAMKERDKPRKEALSLLLSALKAKAIDKRGELTEEEENAVVLREIKQCQEAIDTAPAGREDVRAENQGRIAAYQPFAPKMMDEGEIDQAIGETLAALGIETPAAKDLGRIMQKLMPQLKGKADAALVQRRLKSRIQ